MKLGCAGFTVLPIVQAPMNAVTSWDAPVL